MIMLAAAAALLFGLTSCNLDIVDNYSVAIGYEFIIEDDALRAEMQAFMEDFAAQPGMTAEFGQRTYSDAVALGQQFFTQALDQLDLQFIMDHIQADDDVIRMACVMTGTNLQEIISSIYWNMDWKQEMLLY
jgi:hypothetical protein